MSALVIKSWRADTKTIDSQGNFVSITGREGGLIAWLLALMGVDPTTTILVGLDRVEFSGASWAGTETRLIPLEGICSSYYGYYKPWKTAVGIAFIFGFIGFSSRRFDLFLLLSAIGAVIALVYYFLNRTLTLGFVEHSSVVNAIRFKRSVIENKDINHEQAKYVCLIVQKLIEAKEKRIFQSPK